MTMQTLPFGWGHSEMTIVCSLVVAIASRLRPRRVASTIRIFLGQIDVSSFGVSVVSDRQLVGLVRGRARPPGVGRPEDKAVFVQDDFDLQRLGAWISSPKKIGIGQTGSRHGTPESFSCLRRSLSVTATPPHCGFVPPRSIARILSPWTHLTTLVSELDRSGETRRVPSIDFGPGVPSASGPMVVGGSAASQQAETGYQTAHPSVSPRAASKASDNSHRKAPPPGMQEATHPPSKLQIAS